MIFFLRSLKIMITIRTSLVVVFRTIPKSDKEKKMFTPKWVPDCKIGVYKRK